MARSLAFENSSDHALLFPFCTRGCFQPSMTCSKAHVPCIRNLDTILIIGNVLVPKGTDRIFASIMQTRNVINEKRNWLSDEESSSMIELRFYYRLIVLWSDSSLVCRETRILVPPRATTTAPKESKSSGETEPAYKIIISSLVTKNRPASSM